MIFVHIACYRDPECEPTVRDLLAKARRPEEIRIVVVLQQMQDDKFQFTADRTEIKFVDAEKTKGACWARNYGYQFWDGEEHILQIDSHMRFVKDWDILLYRQMAMALRSSPDSSKVLLTTYPGPYLPPNTIPEMNPCFLRAEKFGEDKRLSQGGSIWHLQPTDPPAMTALMSANFLFGPSRWIKEVPYDPHLYFAGEEPTLAARLWTNGWDLFCPSQAIVFHKYNRDGRRLHWDDDLLWHRKDHTSLLRYRHLFAIEATDDEAALAEIDKYGLGTVRSFEQYQRFAGIHYQHQIITDFAKQGKWTL